MPLEFLLLFLLSVFTVNCQNKLVDRYSPSIAALNRDRMITLFSLRDRSKEHASRRHPFTSFKAFTGGNLASCEDETLKKAYLMLSTMGKSAQSVFGFGLLVLKTFETIQMTYGGERVAGWAIQNGALQLDHCFMKNHEVIHLPNDGALPDAMATVRAGQPLPEEMYMRFGRNDAHNWLTFVTKRGRIYDLDLSAFQFGTMDPFPCIAPVLSAEPTAFNGLVERERVFGAGLLSFKYSVYSLIDVKVETVNMIGGRAEPLLADDLIEHHQLINDRVMQHDPLQMVPFADPAYFWQALSSL